MVSSESLLRALGMPSSDPEVVALLRDLDVGDAPAIEDDASSDVEVVKHGVALFFRTAHHLRAIDGATRSNSNTQQPFSQRFTHAIHLLRV